MAKEEDIKKTEEITDEIQQLRIKDFIGLWEEFDLVCGDRGIFPVQRVKLFELYLKCNNKQDLIDIKEILGGLYRK